jgi:hypothetical protein
VVVVVHPADTAASWRLLATAVATALATATEHIIIIKKPTA